MDMMDNDFNGGGEDADKRSGEKKAIRKWKKTEICVKDAPYCAINILRFNIFKVPLGNGHNFVQ